MTGTTSYIDPSSQPPPRERKRRISWLRVGLTLFLLMVGSFFTAAYYIKGITPANMFSAGNLFRSAIFETPFNHKRQVNILLLGTDVPFGNGFSRTDVMKLLHVDLDKQRMAMISIPRDTWVELPNGRKGRINSAYSLGSSQNPEDHIANAKLAVTSLFADITGKNIPIDYYMRIQPEGLAKVVDALGGVDIDVEKRMYYQDPSQGLNIDLQPGMQHLNGYNAMCYVRFRHDARGDIGRIERQTKLFQALTTKFKDPASKDKYLQLIGPIMSMMRTNLRGADLKAIYKLAKQVGQEGLGQNSATLPTVPMRKGGAEVVSVEDREAAARVISETLNGLRPTVVVLNGSSRVGMAKKVSESIDGDAYNVVAVGSTLTPATATHIFATSQRAGDAEQLIAKLGLPAVAVDTKGTPPPAKSSQTADAAAPAAEITLVLGDDYQQPDASARIDR